MSKSKKKSIFCKKNQICNIKVLITIVYLLLSPFLKAQIVDSAYLYNQWKAMWIMEPESNPNDYGVYYFRKKFELTSLQKTFPVHVSADNCYKLFVNEKLVSIGPAKGDIAHWNYETVDLTPYLHVGQNIVAAQVWNEGTRRPVGQISSRTAFILQGGTNEAQIINTDKTWKCIQDNGYAPIRPLLPSYAAGQGELVNIASQPKGFENIALNDSSWQNAKIISAGRPKSIIGKYGIAGGWLLVPSAIPQMELAQQRLVKVQKVEGISVPASFPKSKTSVTIPSNTLATFLLDQTFLTNAYFTLIFSGGKSGAISISYQEALYSEFPKKGNRNEIEGKTMIGVKDSILSDGTENQKFTTLNWRTYRYVQVRVETKETPLVLNDVYGTFTAYPFVLNARLETNNQELKKMFDIGWRTARLCAMETYMDCPYYEQMQYIGDTRIQALVSLYNSGDDRLVRNALTQMDYSRQPEGLTLSRHPTRMPQIIPTFSLWYIAMLHDYMMYGKDPDFVKDKLPGARQILHFFKKYQQPDGSLKNIPYWSFTDWVNAEGWETGQAPTGANGDAALMDLQYLQALQLSIELEENIGLKEFATMYRETAEELKETIKNKYWDDTKKLFADRAEKDLFSQHANALAILTGLVTGNEAAGIGQKLLSDTTLAPASIYFRYYVHLALAKAGFADNYLDWLNKWRENIDMGLTTWAEISDVNKSRSDCHAWGSSPNIEFFRILLGIDSDAPGFTKIKIEPHLGSITTIGGEMPHPKGKIAVKYVVTNGHFNTEINLPLKTTGYLVWQGKSYDLKEGNNKIKL